jgi:hypothetical protein
MDTYSLAQIGEILRRDWPNADQFAKIPFGARLAELGESREHGTHVKSVLLNMRKLLSQQPVQALSDHEAPLSEDGLRVFLDVWHEIRGKGGVFAQLPFGHEDLDAFLLVAALYHDIGKVIHKDRHPLEGYQYIKNVDRDEANRLSLMLGEERARLMGRLIRFHDLFGVIGTGEGSLPVLVDAITYHSSTPGEQLANLSLLLCLNLSDIAGVIPLKSPKAGTLAADWLRLRGHLESAKGDRQRFSNDLVRSEQTPAQAIERIRRLLLERPPDTMRSAFDDPDKIGEILRITMGTQFYEFWADFALVCKMDYCLRFVIKLEAYVADNKLESDRVIEVLIALTKELVQSYSALTKRLDGSRRRIGIEVSGWTRTPQISDSLISILISNLPLGVGWAAEEATAWYVE